jgi:hypothetical protein
VRVGGGDGLGPWYRWVAAIEIEVDRMLVAMEIAAADTRGDEPRSVALEAVLAELDELDLLENDA